MRNAMKGGGRAARTTLVLALALAATLLVSGAAVAQVPDVPTSVDLDLPFTPIQNVYIEDFEAGDGGYAASGTASWEYGTAVSPPEALPGQGPNMWGTNLDGDYGNLECGYVQSAAIDLSAVPAGLPETPVRLGRLAFRHWMHVENRYDAGLVLASADGTTWAPITPVGGYTGVPLTTASACLGLPAGGSAYTSSVVPAANAWNLAEFDITPYLGGTLQLRWAFATDSSVVKRGWYVDDVIVQLGVGASVHIPLPTGPSGVPFTPISAVYAEDFEASDGGWSAAGTGAWEWGAPVDPPVTVPGSLNVWGTRLASDYLNNECATLTSPPIELPAAGGLPGLDVARLGFKLWRHLESGYDGVTLQSSVDDGATWQTMQPEGGYDGTVGPTAVRTCLGTGGPAWSGPSTAPKSDDWEQVSVNAGHLLGSTVLLRLAFATDGSVVKRGAYVDDVIIQIGVGATTPGLDDNPCAAAPGWSAGGTNSSWCYGSPTTGPFSPKPVFATNLDGQYSASECSAITSPPIDTNAVPGLGTLTFTFEHFIDTASTDDGGVVQVSKDAGATWATVTPVGGYNSSLGTSARTCVGGATTQPGFSGNPAADYTFREVKLGSYQGQTIQVRFMFGSGSFTHDLGWYVRTVGINRGAGSVPLMP